MRVLFTRGLCLSSLLLAAGLQAQDNTYDNVEITANAVTDGIYYLSGEGGNIGLSVGEDGVFIIDDQYAPLTGKINAAISRFSEEPVSFLINTHYHGDHTGGNVNFGTAGAVIIAHENTRRRLASDQVISVLNAPQPATPAAGLPQLTFNQGMTLHFNGDTVRVMYIGSGHTDTDAIVHFVEDNVIHTGDMFVRYGLPFIDIGNGGNINGMISGIHTLISMSDSETRIIPGHGELSGRADLIDFVTMLETIRDRVWEGIKEGRSLEQLIAEEPAAGYTAGLIDHETFTRIAYQSFFK